MFCPTHCITSGGPWYLRACVCLKIGKLFRRRLWLWWCGFVSANSSPLPASMWRLRILCQCHNSWPSAMVAIMETSIRIPTPCSSQMVLNGAWAKALFSFYPVLSETCSCWLRWTVWDSSLRLIFPWMKLFRLENKDVPGRWESSYPWQRHLCSFSFQSQTRFSQLILLTICCQSIALSDLLSLHA